MTQNLGRYSNHHAGNIDVMNHGADNRKYGVIAAQDEPGYSQMVAASRMRTNSNNSILSVQSRNSSNSNVRQNDATNHSINQIPQQAQQRSGASFIAENAFQPTQNVSHPASGGAGRQYNDFNQYQKQSRPGSNQGHRQMQQSDMRQQNYHNYRSGKGTSQTSMSQYSSSHKPQNSGNTHAVNNMVHNQNMHQLHHQKENVNLSNSNIARMQPQAQEHSSKIKLHKNSMTIINRQQHIQSRERSHSGSQKTSSQTRAPEGQSQGYQTHKVGDQRHQLSKASQPIENVGNFQYQGQHQYQHIQQKFLIDSQKQYNSQKSTKNPEPITVPKPQSQSHPTANYESIKQQIRSHQQQKQQQHLQNLLNDSKQTNIWQNNQGQQQVESESRDFTPDSLQQSQNKSPTPLGEHETQCEPVEALKSPLNDLQNNQHYGQGRSGAYSALDKNLQKRPSFFGDGAMSGQMAANQHPQLVQQPYRHSQSNQVLAGGDNQPTQPQAPYANNRNASSQNLAAQMPATGTAASKYPGQGSQSLSQMSQQARQQAPIASFIPGDNEEQYKDSRPSIGQVQQQMLTNNRFSLDQPQMVMSSESNKNIMNQSVFENVESIVGGAQGYVTSTFGNKAGTHSRGHSRGNGSLSQVLGNEDTMGVLGPSASGLAGVMQNQQQAVQQEVYPAEQPSQRNDHCAETQERTTTEQEDGDYERVINESNAMLVNLQYPDKSSSNNKRPPALQFQKSQMELHHQKSGGHLPHQHQNPQVAGPTKLKLVTSRNIKNGKIQALQPNKSVILKTQNSTINDLKSTANGSGIKKLKIKLTTDHSSRGQLEASSQFNQTPNERSGITKIQKQKDQQQQKPMKNVQEKHNGSKHSSQRKRLQQNLSSPGLVFNPGEQTDCKRKGHHVRQRNSVVSSNLASKSSANKNNGGSTNACSPPIHIHYHNLNYIQVVNNKDQQENMDLTNKSQLSHIHMNKLNLSQLSQGGQTAAPGQAGADAQRPKSHSRDIASPNDHRQFANQNLDIVQSQSRKSTSKENPASKKNGIKKVVSPSDSVRFIDKSKTKRQNSNNSKSNKSSISGRSALKNNNKNLSQSRGEKARQEVLLNINHYENTRRQHNLENQQKLRPNSPVNFEGQINLINQQMQNQTGRPKKIDETLIQKLQESLFNLQNNQQSLMTDSLEGTFDHGADAQSQYRLPDSHGGKAQAEQHNQDQKSSHLLSSRMRATPTNSVMNSTGIHSVQKSTHQLPIANEEPVKQINAQNFQQKYQQQMNDHANKDVMLMKRQQVSQENRAKLVSNLAKFIKINTTRSNCTNSNQPSKRDTMGDPQLEDVVQNNLRKFLQYLEVNNIININDLQRDKEQYSIFMQKFQNIDYSQIQDPNFMNDQLQLIENSQKQMNRDYQRMHRCSSGDSKNMSNSNHKGNFNRQQTGSSLEMGHSRRQGTPVNMTSINNGEAATEPTRCSQQQHAGQYLYTQGTNPTRVSTSNNLQTSQISNNSQSRLQTSSSQLSNKYNSSNDQQIFQKQDVLRNSSQSQILQNTSQSKFGPHPQMSRQQKRTNTQISLPTQNSQVSNSQVSNQAASDQIQQPQVSQLQNNLKAQYMIPYQELQPSNQMSHNQNHSTSSNRHSYNPSNATSSNNICIQRSRKNHCSTDNSHNGNINPTSMISNNRNNRSPAKQNEQRQNQAQHNMPSNQPNRSSSQPNQDIQQLQNMQPATNPNLHPEQNHRQIANLQQQQQLKPQIHHNTTINLSINANVGNLNINQPNHQAANMELNQQRNSSQLNNQANQSENQRQDYLHANNRQSEYAGQIKRSNKNIISQQQQIRGYPTNSGGQLIHNQLSKNGSKNMKGAHNDNDLSQLVQQKQKRGGSHEEQARDRMKQLLQTNDSSANEDKHQNAPNQSQHQKVANYNHSSRGSTALANYKAFGMAAPGQNGVGSAATSKHHHGQQRARTDSRQRSIHKKQEHIKQSQQQQLNEQIMNDRDKIIKYNKQYIKRYGKFPPTSLDYYKFVKKIGNGAFGQVYLAIHKLTGKFVAIKMIELSQLKDKYSQRKVFQEVYILKKIRHSNIIRLYEVFENKKHIMMVMEYAGGGDLYLLVKNSKFLTEDETKYIFKKIAQGIAHCHCRSVLHRDIKLDNILLDGEGGVKICDFGVSRLVTKDEMIQEQCGTPAYLAPEMASNSLYKGFNVDIWSLGILLYIMLQGTVPFKASSMEGLYECQKQRNIKFPVDISLEAKELIMRMLVINPEERISIPEMLSHPWLKNIIGPDGFPVEDENEDDDDHNFSMSLSFQRQECNLNPLSVGGQETDKPEDQKGNGLLTERCHQAINQQPDGKAAKASQNGKNVQQIGNINIINIQNLFTNELASKNKLSYMNYCAVTQDFNTYRIDEEALRVLEQFGYPRKLVIESLNKGELNHATCSYDLHVMN